MRLSASLEANCDTATLLGVVYLRPLDDGGMRGKIDTPDECSGTDKYLKVVVGEKLLNQTMVPASHAGTVKYTETEL